MFLIVGLGNPSKKYEHTRHNVGFMVLDTFAEKQGLLEFHFDKKSDSFISESFLNEHKIILAKPQAFMNNSGNSVKTLTKNYKLQTKNLIVVHDDIDIPLGKIKVSFGRGSAGHKGVESIIKELGTKNFTRIRIGIQPEKGKPKDVEDFVLKKFAKGETETFKEALEQSSRMIEATLKDGIERAMNEYNK